MPDYSYELQKNFNDISGNTCVNCSDDHLYDYALGFIILIAAVLIRKIFKYNRR